MSIIQLLYWHVIVMIRKYDKSVYMSSCLEYTYITLTETDNLTLLNKLYCTLFKDCSQNIMPLLGDEALSRKSCMS